MKMTLLVSATTLALAACASTPPASTRAPASASTAKAATANLASASGSLVSGKVSLLPMADGVRLRGEIGGLGSARTHAIHVHQNGDCSAADASSAGDHFNPAGSKHGRMGSGMNHAGDMNNIVANADGVATVDMQLGGVTLGGGAANDIAGRGLVVHAMADDYTTQPGGNSGVRVACGVITVVR